MISFIKKNWPLVLLITIFVVTCFAEVGYALPMHVIGDEESLIGGALQMLKLHTLIPAQHPEEFSFFYYPPLIAYLIIIASTPVIAWHYVTGHFSLQSVTDYVALNQDGIWVASRLLGVLFSALLLFVIFDLAQRLYNRRVAYGAVALLTTSFFFNNLAHWTRHWVFATFFAYLTFLLVYRYVNRQLKQWWLPSIAAALGIGVSYITAFGPLIAGFYVLAKRKVIVNFKLFSIGSIVIGTVLGGGLVLLNYPELFKIFGHEDGTVLEPKTIAGFLSLLWYAVRTYAYQETVIALLAVASLVIARYRKMHALAFVIGIFYFIVLYLFFHIEIRYVYFMLPMLAIMGAATLDALAQRIPNRSICIAIMLLIFAWPFAVTVRYHYLLLVPDTRVMAQRWITEHSGSQEFMLSSVSLRLPRTAESLTRAEEFGHINAPERYYLQNHDHLVSSVPRYNFQNIHFWSADASTATVAHYIDEMKPRYVIVEQWKADEPSPLVTYVQSRGTLITEFSESSRGDEYDVNNNFFSFNNVLFMIDRLGPTMRIYSLR